MQKVLLSLVIILLLVHYSISQNQKPSQSQSKNTPAKVFGIRPKEKPKEKVKVILQQVSKSQLVPNSLFLTSPEIKLFSGHVLNFLRTVCPRVNSTRIYEIQKLISTRSTASIHQASDKKTAFNQVLKSLRACNTKTAFSHHHQQPLQPFDKFWRNIADGLYSTVDYLGILNLPGAFENCMNAGMNVFRNIVSLSSIKKRVALLMKKEKLFLKTKKDYMNSVSKKGWKTHKSQSQTTTTTTSNTADPTTAKTTEPPSEGLLKYQMFVDELFRLYSKSCGPQLKLNLFFKAAGQDLISYLSHDKHFLEKSAATFLDLDFLQSISRCKQNQSALFNFF